MRLICGVYSLSDKPASEWPIRRMISGMIEAPLNPLVSTWHDDSISLAVLDFSVRNNPASVATLATGMDGSVLAADIQLHERKQLAQNLRIEASDRNNTTDETLALIAFDKWGGNAPAYLLGDFALAHWNPHDRRLTCSRDIMGVRPFFYVYRPGHFFAFASLTRALHTAGFATTTLNETHLLAKYTNSPETADESMFRDICRLPNAHTLTVSPSGLAEHDYWRIKDTPRSISKLSLAEAAEGLREHVTEAVSCRLPHNAPVGAHLSGGLDSSALTVLAARMMRERAQTVLAYSLLATVIDDVPLLDERRYVEAVLTQESNIRWKPIYREPLDETLNPPTDIDVPTSVSLLHPENQICADAKAKGASIILSGWGGDEGVTFNGRGTLAESFLHGDWNHAASEIMAISRTSQRTPLSIFSSEVLSYLYPEFLSVIAARVKNRSRGGTNKTIVAAKYAKLVKKSYIKLDADGQHNRRTLLSSRHITARCQDWALLGARHGIAFAFPMLDRRVIDFALKVPSSLFVQNGWRRRPFREAMASVLPEEIRWRRGKYAPFPCIGLDLAKQRAKALQRVQTLRQATRVAELFDLSALEKSIHAIPSEDQLRSRALAAHANGAQLISPHSSLIRSFLFASYIEQHHS